MTRPALLHTLAAHGWRRWLNTVQHADAADLLAALPDASVDLCLADAPYNTTACEWEMELDLDWWWVAMARVMRPRGAVVMTASQPFTSRLVMSNLKWFRYEVVWRKTLGGGFLNANRQPLKRHENILVFYDAFGIYNPQMETGTPYFSTSKSVGDTFRDKTVAGWQTDNINGTRFPISVLFFKSEGSSLHPTQKPVALFEYLIRTYTQPGDLVIDPFVGSGTTALAARNTGRRFIVGDISADYCAIARDRLDTTPYKPVDATGDDVSDLPLFAGRA
jgi:DNA modification methylase